MEILVDGRKRKIRPVATVGELVSRLGLAKEEVLVKVNGRLAADSTPICKKDEIKVMRVIFGG